MTKTANNQQRTLFKTKPNKAKVKIGKMNVRIATIKDYDKKNEQSTMNVIQNKANFSYFPVAKEANPSLYSENTNPERIFGVLI